MKVVHVTGSLSRLGEGVASVAWSLARYQMRAGIRTQVVGLEDTYTAKDVAKRPPLPWYAGRVFGPLRFGYSPDMRRYLRSLSGRVDIVHVHGLWMYHGREARRLAAAGDVPLVISPHGMLDPWALRSSLLKKRAALWLYEKRNLREAACIHALCEAELKAVRALGLTNPVAVVPNGVDLPDTSDHNMPDPAPREWENRKVILFLSRVAPKKGLLNLMDAWYAARLGEQDWVLAIAGPDKNGHQAEVQKRIDTLGLNSSVRFVGPQYGAAKEAWLRRADAFVLPSLSEGFTMAGLEALAYGLPAILSHQCNFPEAEACGAALCVEPRPDALADALKGLAGLSDKERADMGRQGKALVERHYSWSRIAQRMLRVYAWLMHGGQAPDWIVIN